MDILVAIDHDTLPYRVVVEDDERVAYAYLLREGRIVTHVWLYNHGPTPVEPEWRDRSKMPFMNPKGYAVGGIVRPIASDDEVHVEWNERDAVIDDVSVYIRGEPIAKLSPGAKPGWCIYAAKDGPLAKVLKRE
jgi:hypothetical protein